MPIYEYQCSICGHKLEALQNISDPPMKECPNCHKPGLNKLISAVGFQLKGTGWYKTDYSAKGKKPAQEKEGSADSGGTEKKTAETKTQDASSSKTADSTSTKDGTKSS